MGRGDFVKLCDLSGEVDMGRLGEVVHVVAYLQGSLEVLVSIVKDKLCRCSRP